MTTFDLYAQPQPQLARQPKLPMHPVAAAWLLVSTWIERARQRQALATLDGHMLRDIGITRIDAARECEKPFWK